MVSSFFSSSDSTAARGTGGRMLNSKQLTRDTIRSDISLHRRSDTCVIGKGASLGGGGGTERSGNAGGGANAMGGGITVSSEGGGDTSMRLGGDGSGSFGGDGSEGNWPGASWSGGGWVLARTSDSEATFFSFRFITSSCHGVSPDPFGAGGGGFGFGLGWGGGGSDFSVFSATTAFPVSWLGTVETLLSGFGGGLLGLGWGGGASGSGGTWGSSSAAPSSSAGACSACSIWS